MESKQVTADMPLLEFLMEHGQYSTRTRARTAIKAGAITVDGKVLKIPSADLTAGQTVTWQSLAAHKQVKDFDLGGTASDRAKATKAPYEVVYEDENILAYIKPAGIVFASPKPQVKTSFTAMKTWMTKARPKCECIQFVNRIEKESSGISIIAKTWCGASICKRNGNSFNGDCTCWWKGICQLTMCSFASTKKRGKRSEQSTNSLIAPCAPLRRTPC